MLKTKYVLFYNGILYKVAVINKFREVQLHHALIKHLKLVNSQSECFI